MSEGNAMNIRATRVVAYLAAMGAWAACAAPAHAGVVYSGVVNLNIPSTTDGLYLNVVTGQTSTSSAATPSGWDVNLWGNSSLSLFSPSPSPGGGAYVGSGSLYRNVPFVGGVLVGPADTFTNVGVATLNPGTPLNLNSSNNGIGFRFINELTGNQVHYGYLRFSVSSSASSQPRAVVEYYYESTPGFALNIFPSPGTGAIVVVGSAALVGRRRARV
ncbi:MAG: hypothetical protein ACKVZJ_00460 [Phycisphaerales bacterium]